jgi:uracil-DNA glycosylase
MTSRAELDRLLAEVAACAVCAQHLPLGPRPILQIGSGARLLIAGQAPGRIVHQRGIPFDDRAGDALRAWLGLERAIFYDRERVAILPIGLCYPGARPGRRLAAAPRMRAALADTSAGNDAGGAPDRPARPPRPAPPS